MSAGYQLWIPDLLRDYGLDPIVHAGWDTRGSVGFDPRGSVNHHTVGPRTGVFPSLAVLTYGRSGLPGPLCNVGLDRQWRPHVIAAGRANHAGRGGWAGLSGNSSVLGLECENTGYGTGPNAEPWHPGQVEVMATIHAALADGAGFGHGTVCQHFEWTSRKIDAHSIHGPTFRAMVAQRLGRRAPTTPTSEEDDDMPLLLIQKKGDKDVWLTDMVTKSKIANEDHLTDVRFLLGALGKSTEVRTVSARVVDNMPRNVSDQDWLLYARGIATAAAEATARRIGDLAVDVTNEVDAADLVGPIASGVADEFVRRLTTST